MPRRECDTCGETPEAKDETQEQKKKEDYHPKKEGRHTHKSGALLSLLDGLLAAES